MKSSRLDLILLLVIALAPARAIALVNPVRGISLQWLTGILLIAIVLGFGLAGRRAVGGVAHVLAIGGGALGVLALTVAVMPDASPVETASDRLGRLAGEIVVWIQAARGHQFLIDDLLFFLLCGLVAWIFGYLGGLAVARHRAIGLPIIVGVALLALLLASYPSLADYAPIQLIAAVLLLARANRHARWRGVQTRIGDRASAPGEGLAGVALAVGLVAVGWYVPTTLASGGVAEAASRARDGWSQLSRLSVPGLHTGAPTTGGFGTMTFHGAFHLADNPVLRIASPRPELWRAVVYDTYTGSGWTVSPPRQLSLAPNVDLRTPVARERAALVQQVSVLAARGGYLIGASDPIKFDRPSTVQAYDAGAAVDLLSAESKAALTPGTSYAVTSEVSTATPEQLRSAGTEYPIAIATHYLPLPSIPFRVRRLARQVTYRQPDPYGKALAVETYLRRLTYSEDVPAPPPSRDGVDYFLFQSRAGYCDYFASAMAVMLRSVGVPARVASGYASGTPQADGSYLVRDQSAHSWTEVYFPGYGWIPFDPTPGWTDPPRGPENAPPPTPVAPPPSAKVGVELAPPPADVLTRTSSPVQSTARWAESHPFPVIGLLGVFAALAAAVGSGWVWWRDLAGVPAPVAYYARMVWLSSALGFGPRPAQTPGEYARSLSRAIPDASDEVERIAGEYGRYVFGSRAAPAGRELLPRWKTVRRALLRRVVHAPGALLDRLGSIRRG